MSDRRAHLAMAIVRREGEASVWTSFSDWWKRNVWSMTKGCGLSLSSVHETSSDCTLRMLM